MSATAHLQPTQNSFILSAAQPKDRESLNPTHTLNPFLTTKP